MPFIFNDVVKRARHPPIPDFWSVDKNPEPNDLCLSARVPETYGELLHIV